MSNKHRKKQKKALSPAEQQRKLANGDSLTRMQDAVAKRHADKLAQLGIDAKNGGYEARSAIVALEIQQDVSRTLKKARALGFNDNGLEVQIRIVGGKTEIVMQKPRKGLSKAFHTVATPFRVVGKALNTTVAGVALLVTVFAMAFGQGTVPATAGHNPNAAPTVQTMAYDATRDAAGAWIDARIGAIPGAYAKSLLRMTTDGVSDLARQYTQAADPAQAKTIAPGKTADATAKPLPARPAGQASGPIVAQ